MSALNGQKTSQQEKEATRGRVRQWLDSHGKLPEAPAAKEDEQHAANRTEAISSGGMEPHRYLLGPPPHPQFTATPCALTLRASPAGDIPGSCTRHTNRPIFFQAPERGDPRGSLLLAVFIYKKGCCDPVLRRHAHRPLRSFLTGAAFAPRPNGPEPPARLEDLRRNRKITTRKGHRLRRGHIFPEGYRQKNASFSNQAGASPG